MTAIFYTAAAGRGGWSTKRILSRRRISRQASAADGHSSNIFSCKRAPLYLRWTICTAHGSLSRQIQSDVANRVLHPTGDGKEVPLGYTREWSGLVKLTNKSIPGIELSYQALFDLSDGSGSADPSAFQWRLNPDGMKKQTTTSYIHGLDLTQVLSNSTYYTLSPPSKLF